MKQQDLLLCDSDVEYVRRFASYIMEHADGVKLHIFTDTKAYFLDKGSYDIGILSKDFMELSDFDAGKTINEKFYLCDEENTLNIPKEQIIYRYQSMGSIVDIINRCANNTRLRERRKNGNSNDYTFIEAVYSPINHELQLPFAMALGQVYKESGKVLFLDLEEISIMPQLINAKEDKNMLDFLYMLKTKGSSKTAADFECFGEFIRTYQGMDYIPPFVGPDEMSGIDADDWQLIFDAVVSLGYEKVVVLFGRTVNGFDKLLSVIDRLILLSKPGDFYEKSVNEFMAYIMRQKINTAIVPVQLPMSAGNLSDGSYRIEELLVGNLGMFIRHLITDGTLLEKIA